MIRRFLEWMRELPRRLNRDLLWDAFMVYLAVINLSLIVFDFTYLWLRPWYHRTIPAVTRIYDPVKGIEPHPVTEEYLEATNDLRVVLDGGTPTVDVGGDEELEERWRSLRYGSLQGKGDAGRRLEALLAGPDERGPLLVEGTLSDLRRLSRRMLVEDPFARSGQSRSRARIGVGMQDHLVAEGMPGAAELTPVQVFDRFWSWDEIHLPLRLDYFEADLEPILEVNFDRRYDLNGKMVDHFWWIDLPFLLIFTVEFVTRWILAVRRKELARWFLFPILNWYDLLGIIPLRQFRLFRLFRIASIYVRLHKSDRTVVGDDIVTRTVKYFSNIITEEISDMVALRILSETQEELQHGTHRRIIRQVMAGHRDSLSAELTERIGEALNSEPIRRQARDFLDANLQRSVDSAATLQRLPVPDSLLRPIVEVVGRAVFDSIADTLAATVSEDEGREALQEIVGGALDRLTDELVSGELEELVRSISIEVIEHVMEAVAVRKWALPEEEQKTYLDPDTQSA
jgi:hypothetical protein